MSLPADNSISGQLNQPVQTGFSAHETQQSPQDIRIQYTREAILFFRNSPLSHSIPQPLRDYNMAFDNREGS